MLKHFKLPLAALMLTAADPAGAAQAAQANLQGKSVVLVHGAFADGSSWSKVIPLLEARGLHVVAVQNPLSSLQDDVSAAQRAIAQQKGPVILVGHSWGGAVITQAGTDERVKALVYVAAFAPDAGQSVNDMIKPFPPAPWVGALQVDSGGFLTLPQKVILSDFAQDLPVPEGLNVSAVQGPWAARCMDDKLTEAAWLTKPSWYVVAGQDHMIDARFQMAMATKIKAHVVEASASHVVMLSQPAKVAAAIIEAAESVD